MTSSLDSHFGVAKQVSKGTPITVASAFKYFYFSSGPGISPSPIVLPLDQEIGAGSLIRDMQKVGVSTGGAINFIPRPDSLGLLLLGALGAVSSVTGANFSTHTFKFAADEFSLPYFTFRRRVGALGGGEVASDVVVSALAFTFQSANFMRASAGLVGIGQPTYEDDVSLWLPTQYLDETPPLLTCKGVVELPDGSSLKALQGSVTIGNAVPLNEQFIIGSYTPDDAEVVSRAVALSFIVKGDADLYEKMMYDPAQSGAWVPSILKEADMELSFQSAQDVDTGQPYQLSFHFNGETEASGAANVAWSVQPITLAGNRQVLMRITGMVLADTEAFSDGPFSAKLINDTMVY